MNNVLSIPKNTAICPEGSLISLQQSLDAGQDCDVILPLFYALVAQLDRALDYESRGREFESSRARHFSMKNLTNSALSYGAIATLASLPALCFAVIFKMWHWWWMPIH